MVESVVQCSTKAQTLPQPLPKREGGLDFVCAVVTRLKGVA